MAIIESKFFSKELFRSVCVNVILPLPESGDAFFGSKPFTRKRGRSIRCSICCMAWETIRQPGQDIPILSCSPRSGRSQWWNFAAENKGYLPTSRG